MELTNKPVKLGTKVKQTLTKSLDAIDTAFDAGISTIDTIGVSATAINHGMRGIAGSFEEFNLEQQVDVITARQNLIAAQEKAVADLMESHKLDETQARLKLGL